MALLDDILTWTKTDLKPWQSDAVRRLFKKAEGLTASDYDELFILLKAAHGLPNPKNLLAVPLAPEHLPAVPRQGQAVILKAMRDLTHVNRMAPGQTLSFSPVGMTVIYGGNGTGKSGYARVMKQACRARDQSEKVLPDATDPNARNAIPEAVFDIEISGISKQVKWRSGTVTSDDLSTVVVFDSRCARAYISAEQDIAYLPYGLDVVESLANQVLPELGRRLEGEVAAVNIDPQPFVHLRGATQVGRIVVELSAISNTEKIKALAALSTQEENRIIALDHALSESDPKQKAKEFRISATRLKELEKRVHSSAMWVTDDSITKLREMTGAAQKARQAEELAAETFRAGEALLPGTGEAAWKTLFEAARRFAVQVAYPSQEFPNTKEGALCLLCQQPLNDMGARLKRFEKFVQEDAAKSAADTLRQLDAAKSKVEHANLTVNLDPSLAAELNSLDEKCATVVREFERTIGFRRTWMLSASASNNWDGVPSLGESPQKLIRRLAARQLKAARTFERASDDTKKQLLHVERNELRSRQMLAKILDGILALIERMKLRLALEGCRADLKTRPISEKSKELASNAVTVALESALKAEFEALGVEHIKIKLRERNDRGKTMYRLVLDLPTTNRVEEILSEGEQRAIAIGSFLAEIALANHSGPIVFDDPVSSLDHWRRRSVAKRLVQLAANRQVIILTHDTSFLGQLRKEIATSKVQHAIQSVEWRDNNPGYISDGLPWDHQGYKERIAQHKQQQGAFAKLPWPAYPNDELSSQMRHEYDRFRATIERVVQDFILNSVVVRFDDYIQPGKLGDVIGFEEKEIGEIIRLYKKCPGLCDAHDPSSAQNLGVATANEFLLDIQALENVIAIVNDRRNKRKKMSP